MIQGACHCGSVRWQFESQPDGATVCNVMHPNQPLTDMPYPYPKPSHELSEQDIIGAALLSPGFAYDLSTWQLTISNNGLLSQRVRKSQPPNYFAEHIILQRQLSYEQLGMLHELIDNIKFNDLDDEYSCAWTDQPHTRLVVRTDDFVKSVFSYGPHAAAYDGDAHMKRYVQLWDAIVELAPFDA